MSTTMATDMIQTYGPWVLLAGMTVALALVFFKARRPEKSKRKFSAGVVSAGFAFIVCTAVSLNTSYRFTLDGLAMTGTPERVLACAGFEALIMMCVLGARERLASEEKTPGWYGTAVWVFAALAAVPAWHEGHGLTTGTVVRIIVGSFGSALSAHAALGLDLKHRTGQESQGPMAVLLRDLRERVMARLGLTVRNRTAQQIAADRALTKAVELADEHARMTDEERKGKDGRKLSGRLAAQLDRSGVALDGAQKERLLAQLAVRRHAAALHALDLPSPWAETPLEDAHDAVTDTRPEEIEGPLEHPPHSVGPVPVTPAPVVNTTAWKGPEKGGLPAFIALSTKPLVAYPPSALNGGQADTGPEPEGNTASVPAPAEPEPEEEVPAKVPEPVLAATAPKPPAVRARVEGVPARRRPALTHEERVEAIRAAFPGNGLLSVYQARQEVSGRDDAVRAALVELGRWKGVGAP
ncbi:hypothetical protein ACFXDJ_06675 [Streptomyces sp. NPDC059443]|uniref:hypothetical protein n=1 Tax=unclassified Streptomyces TaxID=2593676 RepID=UPI0036886DBC